MYSLKKYGKSPVSEENLLLMGKEAHGLALWDQTREMRFDFNTGQIVSLDDFRKLQKTRAAERDLTRKTGRKPNPAAARQTCPAPEPERPLSTGVIRNNHGFVGQPGLA